MSVFRLLCMCTANRCRSPMAQLIAAELLDERGVDAEVVSAGVLEGGAPATADAVRAVFRMGLDLSAHVSHEVDADTVAAADLVLVMERRHLVTIAELDITAVEHSFTLKELAALAPVVGRREGVVSTSEWIRRASALRPPGGVLAAGTAMDVHDPMGESRRAYRRTADEIRELLDTIFSFMFPSR